MLPGWHRLAWLRRRIGADPQPFTPLPWHPRHHERGITEGAVDEVLDQRADAMLSGKHQRRALMLQLARLDELIEVFHPKALGGDPINAAPRSATSPPLRAISTRSGGEAVKRVVEGEPLREISLSYNRDHSTISRLKARYAAEDCDPLPP
jgi:hypothetical protein